MKDRYDYNALEHLFVGANLREAEMQNQFDRWGIVPYSVVYEDLLADEASEAWYWRFLRERTAKLG